MVYKAIRGAFKKLAVDHYWLLVCLLLLASCKISEGQKKSLPKKLNDGWQVGSLQSVGIDASTVAKAAKSIKSGEYKGQKSLVIVKDGKLVYEAYFAGTTRDSLHRVYSVTKSVASLLIGIAIDSGFILGVDESISTLLPQYSTDIASENKQQISLKHLLMMSSGLDWNETAYPYGDVRNSHYQMDKSKDWSQFILQRPVAFSAGTRWVYNTGSIHLLAAVLERQTGMHADKFAEKYLLKPLGIERAAWTRDPLGYPCVGGSNGGLQITPRDLAKIGWMVLSKGKWQGTRVVSERWLQESITAPIRATQFSEYGLGWWLEKYRVRGQLFLGICAYGYGGQSLHIFPDLNLVIVMTAWAKTPRADTIQVLRKVLLASTTKAS